MRSIAVIPARGGSKRIPRKNIKFFFGKPIIGYAIQTAIESDLFFEIIVSTDDEEIGKIAESFGAKCSWYRSKKLSNDITPTVNVIQDAVQRLQAENFDFVCCIYPATPLLQSEHLKSGFELIKTGKWDYVLAAKSIESDLSRSFTKDQDGRLQQLFPENEMSRTQDLSALYIDAGQFYWGKRSSWKQANPIFSSNSTIVTLNSQQIIDINTQDDWNTAEQMFRDYGRTKYEK